MNKIIEVKKMDKKIKELGEDRSKAIRRLDVIEQLLKGNGKILALQYEEIKTLKSVLRKSKENKIKFAQKHLMTLEEDNEDPRYIEACKRQIKEAEGALKELSGIKSLEDKKIEFPIVIDIRKFQDELVKAASGAWTKNGLEYISAITLDRLIEVAFECLTETRDPWSHSDPLEILKQEIKRLYKNNG